MAVDISKLSRQQLNELILRAESRKSELAKEKIVKVRERVLALLKAEGIALEELFGGRATGRKSRRLIVPKYRNPADHSQTWSGHGKRPRWFNAALKAGKKEKDLLI